MDGEQLIALVRQYPFLYDQEDKLYNDIESKDAAWKEIARKLNKGDKACKKAWGNMRDTFRKYFKKKKESESGQSTVKFRKSRYEDSLSFLIPYMHVNKKELVTTPDIEMNIDEIFTEAKVDEMETEKGKNVANTSPFKKTRKRSREADSSPNTFVKYVIQSDEKSEKIDTDEIELFCKSIICTIERLSSYSKAIIKIKILSILSEFEIKELQQESNMMSLDSSLADLSSYSQILMNDMNPSGSSW